MVVPNLDQPIMVQDDPTDDGQSEACTPLLGREMRKKQFLTILGLNSFSIIGKLNSNPSRI